jgi:UDP-GlcNAc:undecaprenyl-phosphate/decaprenyl-phosphate GlcNAc-1-phosphate transferase
MTPDKSHVHHFLLRMGLKQNQVTLVLASIQIAFILILLIMKDLSDHIALPIISILALGLGFRLDQVTVKYVKKKVAKEPRILEIRKLSDVQKKKIKLENNPFKNAGMNLN